jgi:hypothetical protein
MWSGATTSKAVENVNVTPLDGISATSSFATGGPAKWTGSNSGDYVPQSPALVKLQTGVRGRDNRGRIFVPFIAEGVLSKGVIDAPTVAAMTGAWNNFLAALNALVAPGSWQLVVAAYDRRHLGAGAHATPVINCVAEAETGTMRKRQTRNR